jgi:L-amino acid N-acyltransferase YncA
MPIEVRKAELRDVPAMAAIHVAAWERTYRGVLEDEIIDERTVELRTRVWTEKLSDPPPREVVLVAEVEDGVAGFITGIPSPYEDQDPERVINLNILYLDPEKERKGVAAALYEAFLHAVEELGYEEVEGQLIPENKLSWHFFIEQRGFRRDGYESESTGHTEWRVRQALPELFAALRKD